MELSEAAREYAPLAIKTLVNVMRTGETDAARVSAAKEVLDRAYGKSVQGVRIEAPETENHEELTDRANRFVSAIAGLAAREGKG